MFDRRSLLDSGVTIPDERRRARANLPVSIYRLGDEPEDKLMETTTAEERFDLVRVLSQRMFEIAGGTPAEYRRSEIPIRVIVADD